MSGGPEYKRDILAGLLRTDKLIVTNDAVIALAGATAETGQGIIVIAGTGSIGLGRNREGRIARSGGWGYIFGDEGSAFDIARQALRAALRMEEGWGPPTAVRAGFLGATGADSANAMLHLFYTPDWPRSRVAKLAKLVDEMARHSDPVAAQILNAAAQELATLAAAVRGQLWPPGTRVDLSYIGGVFESEILLERFRTLIELEGGSRCGPPLHGPAEGALLEAWRAAGLDLRLAPRD
jgi:N-acetylglucosamine kinase